MRRISIWVLLLVAFWGQSQASGQTSREETIVRTTYAKLRYAMQIGTIHTVLMRDPNVVPAELEYQVATKMIEFELSNFTTGPVSDISKRIYEDLVTKPNGEGVLDISVGYYNSREELPDKLHVRETNERGAQGTWTSDQILTENWNVPFGQFLPLIDKQNDGKYSRYAAYHVTATYDGRSRSYNAMFLFGTGSEPILVIDTVTNGGALATVTKESLYPAVLLESRLSQKPAVANWLRKHQVSDAQCLGGRRQVCCDVTMQICGPAEADVKSALDKPLSNLTRPSNQLETSIFETSNRKLQGFKNWFR